MFSLLGYEDTSIRQIEAVNDYEVYVRDDYEKGPRGDVLLFIGTQRIYSYNVKTKKITYLHNEYFQYDREYYIGNNGKSISYYDRDKEYFAFIDQQKKVHTVSLKRVKKEIGMSESTNPGVYFSTVYKDKLYMVVNGKIVEIDPKNKKALIIVDTPSTFHLFSSERCRYITVPIYFNEISKHVKQKDGLIIIRRMLKLDNKKHKLVPVLTLTEEKDKIELSLYSSTGIRDSCLYFTAEEKGGKDYSKGLYKYNVKEKKLIKLFDKCDMFWMNEEYILIQREIEIPQQRIQYELFLLNKKDEVIWKTKKLDKVDYVSFSADNSRLFLNVEDFYKPNIKVLSLKELDWE